MKKVIVIGLITVIACIFISCNDTTTGNEYYQLSLENAANYLVYPLEATYQGNTVVEVTTHIIYDADLVLYLNDEKITQTSSDTPYWTYEFNMPNKDSVLRFSVETKQ